MSLGRDTIVAAALQILDQYGLADLSMRRIADVLGVKAGAIYWHFENKQTLLAGVSDAILGDPADWAEPGAGITALGEWAAAFRGQLLLHRDGAELVASTLAVGLGGVDPSGPAVVALSGLGFDATVAPRVAGAMLHFVLGHVVEEQSRRQLIELGVLKAPVEAMDEAGFRTGLDVLLAGVSALAVPTARGDVARSAGS